MEYQELADFLQFVGKDPTTLIFEDELTGIHNRRFILRYLQHKVDWESGSDYPLALLNIDLDNFKEINDGHGHEMGDQVLAWVATLLESVAGEEGLPARYGGDEFLIVLPDTDREGALAVSARLLQTTHDHPFRERDSGLTVPVRLSIGVAVAPEDGQLPDELIHAADTALYVAKHRGRDQAALASELGEESVFPKVALQRLRLQGIAGREEELGAVDRALRGMTSGRSQVLVFEGPPGVGKTTFLEAIDSNLKADRSIMVTRVSGDLKEARRPYYLAARILVDLLNQRGDEGVALLHRLPEAGKAYLAHVMPGLTDGEVPGVLDIEARRGIFTAFTSLLGQAVEDRTLILLIDDMEFADEATFLLLSTAAERGDISFMLCGTVGETLRLSGETQPSPLERFLEDCPDEIRLRNMALRPLGPMAIAEYLNAVFPNLQVPPRFEAELAGVTGGNPFFVSEIIRTLLEDGKVQLVGQNWVIEPVDTADLARSLEGIVTEKIAALDQEERAILERASTLGEEIPVSVLTGSSALDESSVQAFLDRAESLGLVKVGFQVNDEVMRFLGKGILDISYAAIADTRREELHGELGQYQERLFQQGLLSSASILAYHFRRSTDQAKARRYEQTQRAYADTVFHRTEISHYKAGMDTWKVAASVIEEVVEEIKAVTPQDAVVDAIEAGMPLDAEATALVPQALRMILSAMRNVQLYPPESMAITRAMEQAMGTLGAILVRTGRFTLTYDEDGLIANGVPLDLSEVGALEKSVLDLLREAELRAVSFTRDVKVNEVRSLLLTMGTVVPGAIDRDFWRKVCQKEGFRSLEVRQTQYTRIDPSAGGARRADAGGPLSPSEMAPIPDLIRDFIKTASDARLYPPGSERVTDSISALLSSFQPILHRRSSLSLARLEDFVMVNGERVDTTQWESVAAGFTSFLDSAGLLSMTFHSNLSREDLGAFFAQLRDQGGRCPEPGFWERFASEKGLGGIAFNLEAYAPEVIEALLASALQRQAPRPAVARPAPPRPPGADEEGGAESGGRNLGDDDEEVMDRGIALEGKTDPDLGRDPGEWSEVEPDADRAGEVGIDESVAKVAKELLLEGKTDEVRDLMARVFDGYERADVEHRTGMVKLCSKIFHQLVIGLQQQFSEFTLDPLAEAIGAESEPSILVEMSELLFEMAATAIRVSDYRLAARLYDLVETRRSDLKGRGEGPGSPYAVLLNLELDPHTSQLLIEDFRSGLTERQARASLAVGFMGITALELLVDIIKQERDLRVRQLAAGLLGELKGGAVERLKEALLTEVLLEHRYRVLEVADLVTKDLRMELAFNLGDENPKIRRAAFQLFERIGRDDFVPLMMPLARADDPAVAKGAVRSLGTLGTPSAVGAIVDLLQNTESPILAIACCQAVGNLRAEGGVDALSEILSREGRTGGPHWDEEVRATAAVALRQIGSPRSNAILEGHKGDASMRIREAAEPRMAEEF